MFVNSRVFTQAREVETRSYKDPLTLKLQSAKLFNSNIRSFHLFSFFFHVISQESIMWSVRAHLSCSVLIYQAVKLCFATNNVLKRSHGLDWLDFTRLSQIITYPLLLTQFYWLLWVTWFRISAETPVHVDRSKKASSRVTHFHLYYLIWKEIEFVLLSFRKHKKVNKISCQNTTRKLMRGTQDE